MTSIAGLGEAELARIVTAALWRVAPDLEGEPIDPAVPLRRQFDIDSVDFLNFVIAIHEATGLDVPERAYPELQTLDGCVAWLKKQG